MTQNSAISCARQRDHLRAHLHYHFSLVMTSDEWRLCYLYSPDHISHYGHMWLYGENGMSVLHTRPSWMARRVTVFICLLAIWLSTSCEATELDTLAPSVKSPVLRFAPQEILIKFKDGVAQERIAFILKNNQIEVIAEIQRGHLYHVRVLDDRSVESAITQLTSHQEIEYAEPNYRYETKK